MTWFLLVVALAGLAVGGMGGALAVRARRDRDDRLEVVPGVASNAPAEWAGAHSPEARLHRRLGDAVRAMRAQAALASVAEQRVAMEQEALRIDARLIAVAGFPGERRDRSIAEVSVLVDRFEAAVADLVEAALGDTSTLESVISESEVRLRALEEARAEVERLEQGDG